MKFLLVFAIILPSYFGNSLLHAEGMIGFVGQEYSGKGQLTFLRARFNDPEVGSFISKDPVGIADGLNTYQYVKSNPINGVDRTGNALETVWDITNLVIGAGSLGYNLGNQNWGYAALDAGGLVIDGLATAIPFIPGGAAAAIKAGRGIDTAVTVATTLKKTEVAVKEVAQAAAREGIEHTPQRFGSLVHSHVGDNVTNLNKLDWAINVKPGYKGVDFKSPDSSWMMDITTFKNWPTHNKYPEVADTIVGLLYNTSGRIGVGKGLFEASNTGGRLYAGAGTLNGAKSLFDYFNQTGGTKGPGGVLIDKAATLIETNLADIKGATYDPVSGQIVFLGSNSTPGVDGIDMDYFYTAVNSVYGSAAPPFVSLDQPASAASLWQDYGDGDGTFEGGEWGGCSLRYNPLWSGEDGNVKVRIRCVVNGVNYDFSANFTPQTVSWLQFPNGQKPMHLVFTGITGIAPANVSVWNAPFTTLANGATTVPNVSTSQTANGGQDWVYPFQIYNGGTAAMTNFSFSVTPDRQHRRFGGRLENTKLGWVLLEADRLMKCLAIGKDNITGATYSSATLPISGYRNLAEITTGGTIVSGNSRVWFLADEMALKRHVDPASGRATMVFDRSIVGVKTESSLNFQAPNPGVAAFANHLQANYDAFANRSFPVVSPDDGVTIVNVKIFKMLKDAMQAVSLARFLRDNNIPLDLWWMNSWKPPLAYSALSVPTITNETLGVILEGGVDNRKVNTYIPSTSAQSVGTTIAAARPNAAVNPTEDIKQQAWTASTTEGTLKAVAASLKSSGAGQGTINLAETDLSFASPGALPLEFTRYYQSGYIGESVLGAGWRVGRYVLEFEKPSWVDETNMMKYNTNVPIARDSKSDTRVRSGAVRLVDLATGAALDFNSSFTVNYYQTASGTPAVTLAGMSIEQLPVFTAGQRKDGTVLVQNNDGVLGYSAYLPDGSVIVFDPEGRLEITQDRHGYGQWYFRDGKARVTTIQDSANRTLTLAYHPTSGKLTSVTGPQSERADYSYNAAGLLEAVTHQRSGAALARYTYNADDQLLDVKRMDGTTEVTSAPDIKGRSDERKDERNNNFDYSYTQNEATGVNTTQVKDVASSFGPSKQISDDKGRTTSVSDPLNNTVALGYTGGSLSPNSVQLPTPNRPSIKIDRNSKEQPTSISDPAVPGAVPIQIAYNPANRVTQVTDEAGRAIQADYDMTLPKI